jgi:petrobactin synthase
MIRVHCFVSCVCDLLSRAGNIDERPFYFGVWDSDFSVSEEQVLSYHSPLTDHSFYTTWFERLYGVAIHAWYDSTLPKEDNIARLSELLAHRPEHRSVMVMLDLFQLPERENKYNQNPFPHYVMLEATQLPDTWWMRDPDFRWEGALPKARLLEAVRQPSVAGGYYFDGDSVHAPRAQVVREYFEACFRPDANPFTQALRGIVAAHVQGLPRAGLGGLSAALRELPVLALRKYAYEHGFAYFWRALQFDEQEFLRHCDAVELLVKNYTVVQYRAMKLATTGDPALAQSVYAALDEQDQLELSIKCKLAELYSTWCKQSDRHTEGST